MRDIGGGGGGTSTAPRARPNPNYRGDDRGDDRARRDGRSGGRSGGGHARSYPAHPNPNYGADAPRAHPNPNYRGDGGGRNPFQPPGGDLTESVRQAAEEVQAFAAQRALELALEANGLVQKPAQQGLLDELERSAAAAKGMRSPITEGPASRILTAPRRMAAPQGNVGSTLNQLPPAPLGGPSALERVGRPRPTLADKVGPGY